MSGTLKNVKRALKILRLVMAAAFQPTISISHTMLFRYLGHLGHSLCTAGFVPARFLRPSVSSTRLRGLRRPWTRHAAMFRETAGGRVTQAVADRDANLSAVSLCESELNVWLRSSEGGTLSPCEETNEGL